MLASAFDARWQVAGWELVFADAEWGFRRSLGRLWRRGGGVAHPTPETVITELWLLALSPIPISEPTRPS